MIFATLYCAVLLLGIGAEWLYERGKDGLTRDAKTREK